MTASAYALKLASTALGQHAKYRFLDEGDPALCKQIKRYWDDLSLGFTSCTTVPWSAAFVSWCVWKSGATSAEFQFAAAHSIFVYQAINHPGAFQGTDIKLTVPSIGDIIQNNRGGDSRDFQYASTNKNYASHAAIVVELGVDPAGHYAITIGGNEGNSIKRTLVRLDVSGKIKQRTNNPYIAILKNLK